MNVDAEPSDIVVIQLRAQVARSSEEVWKRIGNFFDLNLFLDVPCSVISGDGGLGSVRRVGDDIVEVMVGSTPTSYTYAMIKGPMSAAFYHGMIECRPDRDGESQILYSLVYNQAMPLEGEKSVMQARLTRRFGRVTEKMKQIAEA